MTRTVAVVAEKTVGDAVDQARRALDAGADLVEFRLDFLTHFTAEDARFLARQYGRRAIATLRSPAEGGARSPLRERREEIQEEVCRAGFAYVDVELKAEADQFDDLRKRAASSRTQLIASHHSLAPVGIDDMEERIREACRRGDVGKAAVQTSDFETALTLLDIARDLAREGHRFCLIGLGCLGTITRVLADETLQEFQYVSADPARSAAPGQLSLAAALRLRRRPKIVTGLLGHPVEHSISPTIHDAAFEALGLPGIYLPFDVGPHELSMVFERAKNLRLRGVNVTIPYKESVLDLLDEVDPVAEAVGAVNTVRFEDGHASGHNTDVIGFEQSLRIQGVTVAGRRALVLGSGGAARAITHALLRAGADVSLWNRTRGNAEALARHFGGQPSVVGFEEVASSRYDLVVNATPLGMAGFPAQSPIPSAVWDHAKVALDLVYNPPDTQFLREARSHGAVGVSGLNMLVLQAARAFELFTGKPAPLDAMARAAKGALA